MNGAITLGEALRAARVELTAISDTPGLDAEVLLCRATGLTPTVLLRDDTQVLALLAGTRFREMVRRRAAGEPVAHIVGEREFWSHRFRVSKHTLVPRPDTELLVERTLERVPEDAAWRILDLGTGTGNVALAIALSRPACQVSAVEIDEHALALARENARRLGAVNVEFAHGDWFDGLAGRKFHAVVSNPPYVAHGDPHLRRGDVRFEPARALVSGVDGLDDIRRIVGNAPAHLLSGGWLMLEHGARQAETVRQVLGEAGFVEVTTWRDLAGRERASGARMP